MLGNMAFCAVLAATVHASSKEVASGVWRLRLGEPEALTPLRFRSGDPRIEAMAGMKPGPRPLSPDEIGFRTTERGCSVVLPLQPGEHLFGLGLNLKVFDPTNGRRVMRVSDNQDTDWGDSHAPVPFYVSTLGYGVYVDSARYVSFYMGNLDPVHRPDRDSSEEGKKSSRIVAIDIPIAQGVDIYLFAGPTIRQAVQRYNLFSGGGCLPPLWGLGVWYRASSDLKQEEVLSFLREFRERNIPCDVFGLEPGWHTHAYSCSFVWSERFPDPEGLLSQTAGQGYKLNLWEHAFTHPSSPIHDSLLPFSGDYRVWGGLVPDFAVPKARKIFADFHDETLVSKGVAGFKLDECDHQPVSASPWSFPEMSQFPSGLDGEQMHRLIGPLYQQTIESIYRKRGRRTFCLVRASGDVAAPLPFGIYSDAYNHRDYVRAVATSGFAGLLWCPEVRDAQSVEELYRRMETSVFSACTQINCWFLRNPPWKQVQRDPNNRGEFMENWEEAEAACRRILEQRMALLPYLYSAYAEYHETGMPPARALLMDDPEDPALWTVDDEYMLGPSLLVAPLFTGETKRSVTLPGGDWYDYWTHERFSGGQRIEVSKGWDEIPVFVKGNSLLPLAKPVPCVRSDTTFEVTVHVFGENPDPFVLVEDDGLSFRFEKGEQNKIELRWDGQKGSMTKSGQYAGPDRYHIVEWKQAGR